MSDAPLRPGLLSFGDASGLVIEFLRTAVPMGLWAVTRRVEGRQVYLQVRDDVYGSEAGESHAWPDSCCRFMVTGEAPQIAPRAMAVPQYARSGAARRLRIGAYAGAVIRDGDGRLFGTLLGLDPEPQPEALARHAPLLQLLATLLGQLLPADRLLVAGPGAAAGVRWADFADPLTGLASRALFTDRLDHAMALQRRDLRTISVLLIGLDTAGAVPEGPGRDRGDLVLAEVGHRLRGCLRAGDTATRLGRDEFAVLIEDGGPPATIARKLVDRLQEPFTVQGATVILGVSIGAAEASPFGASAKPESILADADAALYAAKRAGRGRFEVHHGPDHPAMPAVPGASRAAEGSSTRAVVPSPGQDS
jgi:diguanylate cyclase (GGDEF)-like protein